MGLYIHAATPTIKDAEKYAEDHVIISKRDLRRIKRLAKKHGFLKELLALKITMQTLGLTPE